MRGHEHLCEQIAVGRGSAVFLDGRAPDLGGAKGVSIVLGDRSHPAMGWGMAAPGSHIRDYWWGVVPLAGIDPEARRRVELALRVRRARGAIETLELGALELIGRLDAPPGAVDGPVSAVQGSGPLVAICMATYEPDRELLRRQVASIRAQTHERWICIISDDGSSAPAVEEIERAIGGDPRFRLDRAATNAGFYRNFERALSMVPPEAQFVALCDQDDDWHPEKLEALIEAIGTEASLAYSDMRIVEPGGAVLSPTAWNFRENNHTDFPSLLLANTVTGAASLFRGELLEFVLPFPPPYRNLFHDHWIAQVALALGPLAYVDRPLYDYVQHEGAEIGHFGANGRGRFSDPLPRRMLGAIGGYRERGYRLGWRAPYFNVHCRVALCATALRMRCEGRLSLERAVVLDEIAESGPRPAWLLARALGNPPGGRSTLGRERVMLAGLAWRGVVEVRRRLASALGGDPRQRSWRR